MPPALIVDAPSKFRTLLCAELAAKLEADEILETDGVKEGFRLAREHRPGLVLVDVERFGSPGMDFVRRVAATLPSVALLVLSGTEASQAPVRALRAGAHGFVVKQRGLEEVMQAVRGVLSGYLVFPLQTLETVRQLGEQQQAGLPRLSNREITILQYLARGHSNKSIAAQLLISSKTVSTHKTNIMAKLHVGSLVEMVDYARRHQLVW
ncbi:response regulator transcription factor [Cupriavidus necator]|uniref:response regulator transcription factor n=1 Tax=Cupriavidus necator TaxID=106590 RepID=UPI00278B8457|nr:response regulator transcription factor [Cupriavidus necator]MDQ0143683.1 DNA-binding NarL/FixJ family response regulator [Cupriavidus necator]